MLLLVVGQPVFGPLLCTDMVLPTFRQTRSPPVHLQHLPDQLQWKGGERRRPVDWQPASQAHVSQQRLCQACEGPSLVHSHTVWTR